MALSAPILKGLPRRSRCGSGAGDHRSSITAGWSGCCRSCSRNGYSGRLLSRRQIAQHAGTRRIAAVAVIRQHQGTYEKDGRQHSRCARQKGGVTRRTEQAARSAATESGSSRSAFALLHEDQADHDQGADNLNRQQNIEKYVHEINETNRICAQGACHNYTRKLCILLGCRNDAQKIIRLECSAANQTTIDIGLCQLFSRVAGVHAAAIQQAYGAGLMIRGSLQLFAQNRMHLLRLLGCGCITRANGPYGFVRHHDFGNA